MWQKVSHIFAIEYIIFPSCGKVSKCQTLSHIYHIEKKKVYRNVLDYLYYCIDVYMQSFYRFLVILLETVYLMKLMMSK